jgi:hypothetical protein
MRVKAIVENTHCLTRSAGLKTALIWRIVVGAEESDAIGVAFDTCSDGIGSQRRLIGSYHGTILKDLGGWVNCDSPHTGLAKTRANCIIIHHVNNIYSHPE